FRSPRLVNLNGSIPSLAHCDAVKREETISSLIFVQKVNGIATRYNWFRQKSNIPPRTGVAMPRTMLTDKSWLKLKELMMNSGRIYNKFDHRMTLEGILYRMRTGIPWRDLPSDFGQWSSVFRRFNLW